MPFASTMCATAATSMLKSGMPKERVSCVLGHANHFIPSSYEHLDLEDIQDAHSRGNPLSGFCNLPSNLR